MDRIIDVSHVIEHDMITYPGLPGPVISDHLSREASRAVYSPGTEFHIGKIAMVANTGTYLDSPSHRYEAGDDLAALPIERLVDLPGLCVRGVAPALGPELLDGLDLAGRAVLFATGWDRHWRTEQYGAGEHPFLAVETAAALVAGGAVMAGIDSVNIDDTRGADRPIHSVLLEAGVLIVEHLTRLDRLVGRRFRFFAAPPMVRGMGTFPVRAFGIIEDESA